MPFLDADKPLVIGINGAGPGGLGAAIFLGQLAGVQVRLYEQATELREVGAGIHLHENTYSMLAKLGRSRDAIDDIGSSGSTDQKAYQEHRNGRTIELLRQVDWSDAPRSRKPIRTERTTLQKALVQELPANTLQLKKKLVKYEELTSGAIRLHFADGSTDQVDVLIGADGLRSVIRQQTFPDHKIAFTGIAAFRTLVPVPLVEDVLADLPSATIFWHGATSHIFTTHVGNGKFELSLRAAVPREGGEVSWGQDIRKEDFLKYFEEFHPDLQRLLDRAPSTGWRQFAMFGGPQLPNIISPSQRIALLGDASHPLSGAFGAGAGFALEDAYILKLALEQSDSVEHALQRYETTRNRHYTKLYDALKPVAKVPNTDVAIPEGFDATLKAKIENGFGTGTEWIYGFDVDASWQETLKLEREEAGAGVGEVAETLEQAHL